MKRSQLPNAVLLRGALVITLLTVALVVPGGNVFGEGWSQASWDVRCIEPNPCAPADENYQLYLKNVSVWLDGLGFSRPRIYWSQSIDPDSGVEGELTYRAEVSFLSPTHYESHPAVQMLYLGDPFAGREPGWADGSEPVTEEELEDYFNELAEPVQELFRAVEYGYQDMGGDQKAWITDGMATAARMAWLDKGFGSAVAADSRLYTSPLDLPDSNDPAAGTWSFWYNVGRQIGSMDKIAWFHDVLGRDLGPQTGLDAVDAALGSHGGLATQLLQFFTKVSAQNPELFDPVSNSAYLPAGVNEREFRFPHAVREVAGKGASVTVTASPDAKTKVEISIEPDHADLHLIVDGRRLDQGSGEQRNRYRDELPKAASNTYELVVANVAQTASASIERKPALVVKLKTEEEADCCSCAVTSAEPLAGGAILPCTFDHPAGWEGQVGDDGGLASAVVGPPACGTVCPTGYGGMSLSVARKPDSNADTMEGIWRQFMPIAGSASCGEGTVTFFSPPGSDPLGTTGGVKFYVQLNGKKYGGAATFTCGEPGGWVPLQKLFIDSFRSNPGTTF